MAGLAPPLSNLEILRGVHRAYGLPENEVQERSKPRASSIMGDAREIAYQMAGVPYSDPFIDNDARVDGAYTQEQGRLAEDITCDAIAASGKVKVINRQIALPEDYFVTGHPDGELAFFDGEEYHPYDVNGLKWGFEHKMLGRFQVKGIAREGLFGGFPEVIAQTLLYGYALGWDAAYIVIGAQDASSMRLELRGKNANPNGLHPKLNVWAVDLRPLYPEHIPFLKARADWLADTMAGGTAPEYVAVEAKDPAGIFPWGYSEYQSLAKSDPPGKLVAPKVPLMAAQDWRK